MIRRALPLACVALLTVPAHAEPEAVFELSVTRAEGTGSCPSGNELERRVSARLGRVPFTARAVQAIEATLSRREDVWHAEITLRDADGIVRGQRQLEATGQDCEPLAEAATLAIALTIDPDAPLAPATATPPPPEPEPAVIPEACPPTAPVSVRRAAPCEGRRTDGVRVAASVRGVLAGGVLPGAAAGVAVHAEAGSRHARVELGLLYLPEVRASDPRFGFGLTTGSLGVCGFPLAEQLELGGCAGLELGGIHAVVHDLEPLEPGDQLWFALALGPRLRLAGPAGSFVELGGAAVIPLLDRTFEVEGLDEPAFATPAIGGLGFVGLGLRAP